MYSEDRVRVRSGNKGRAIACVVAGCRQCHRVEWCSAELNMCQDAASATVGTGEVLECKGSPSSVLVSC